MSSPLSAGKHSATINNLKLNYIVLADSPDLPVVLIHPPPWGIGAEAYIKSFARLSSKYTVVIPSPRGNDDSQRPDSPSEMSSRHIVADLDAFRIHLGLETIPALIGHSSGGTIALGYAIKYPQRVEKLILLHSDMLGYVREDTSFVQEVMQFFMAAPPTNDEEFRALIVKTVPLYFALPDLGGPEEFLKTWTGNPSLWAWGAYSTADAGAPTEGGGPSIGHPTTIWRQIDELDKVQAKTLVLTGEEDRTCAPEVSAAIASRIKWSRLCIIGACGHFSWAERPDVFWEAVESYLEEEM